MDARINYDKVSPGVLQAMLGLEKHLNEHADRKLLNLVYLRASQINGCAFCIDMHWKDLRAEGENEQRLYGLDAWAESPYYSDRERAALAWTEAVTRLGDDHVPEEVFAEASRFFSDSELADLTLGIVAINGWNRLNIAFRTPAGDYRPPAKKAAAAKAPAGRAAQPDAAH